jgi:hypothetical protein
VTETERESLRIREIWPREEEKKNENKMVNP